MEMDPATALELVTHGSTLLLLDVPLHTLVGIDTQMFSVGPAFKGIKMVPPGPHFIYYSSANREGSEFSPVVGFFVVTSPSEIIVRRWNQQDERLVKLSEEEEASYCEAVRKLEFDRHLGPYALNHYGEWKHLSNYITKQTIDRIEPIGGEITVAREAGLVDTVPKTDMEKRLMEQLQNSKFSRPAEISERQGCYYTSIPNVVKHKGVSGQELTSLNLDKTQLLEMILIKGFGGEEDLLLGELQFAFIAFLMGQSLEAFLQWKALVNLMFSCVEAPLHMRSHLYTKFVKVIYYQLKHGFRKDQNNVGFENGASVFLDDSWLTRDTFLHRLCKEFFSLVEEARTVDGNLLSWTRKLKELLETTFGWDFQYGAAEGIYEENDEFSPVVEMLDDETSYDGNRQA